MSGTDGGPAERAPERRPGQVERLAAEFGQLARETPAELKARLDRLPLRLQAELALRLPARERLELLLHAPRPAALVRALPDSEFYLTVREIGPADALPLLSLGSPPQLVHLFDLESWRKDRFDAERAGAWAALLLEAGQDALLRWLRAADDEFLALLFQRWARARAVEAEDARDAAGAAGDTEAGFLSPDGFFRFDPAPVEHAAAVRRLAETFFSEAPGRYFGILRTAQLELPSELEEQEYRWRWSRLEEHGFPPQDEAFSVYAPPSGTRSHPQPLAPLEADSIAVARAPLRLLSGRSLIAGAAELLPADSRDRLLHEIVSVANHVLVADSLDLGDPEAHRAALARAASYIGLALLARGARDEEAAARALEEVPAIELFREGYGSATSIAERAHRLEKEGWVAVHPRAIELLDPPLRLRLRGLLEPRPLYFDARATDPKEAFRDFRAPEEIEETRIALETAECAGEVLLRRMGLDVGELLRLEGGAGRRPPRLGAVLLTVLARHAVERERRFEPLPPSLASEFVRIAVGPGAAGAAERALEDLLRGLAAEFDLPEREVAILRGFGRACLAALRNECRDPETPVAAGCVDCLVLAP